MAWSIRPRTRTRGTTVSVVPFLKLTAIELLLGVVWVATRRAWRRFGSRAGTFLFVQSLLFVESVDLFAAGHATGLSHALATLAALAIGMFVAFNRDTRRQLPRLALKRPPV